VTPGDVDSGSFLAIVAVAALAAVLAGLFAQKLVVPVVVLELVLGIIIGPEALGIAQSDAFVGFFSNLGLGMLFFFAGYEIDFERIKGQPLRLAALGWAISLVLAYSLGGLLSLAGIVLSLIFVGSAMATTAIGTLIPILRDANELKSRFGTYLLGAGAMGEFGPILLITLVFSTKSALSNAAILIAFILLTVITGIVAVRSVGTGWDLIERTLEASSQLAIRVTVVVVFALAALAASLGLDLLLGGFVAGVILRLALRGREVEVLESKLTALGYGFLIPFFFVVSGINVNLSALTSDPIQFLKVPLFLVLFLVVRGTPAMLLYRKVLSARDRTALAFFSATELPLVVAITTIAVEEGHMRSSTAASLIVAAICSTAIFPIVGLKLRGGGGVSEPEPSPQAPTPQPAPV
jgi:Kef-type K+ transport system membrane component KefB